jgi:hypothetical protein
MKAITEASISKDVESKPTTIALTTGNSITPTSSKGEAVIELQNLTEITNVKVGAKLGAGNFGM